MQPAEEAHADLGTRAQDVPQTKASGPRPGEEAALTWIDQALAHQKMVGAREDGRSRENSLAITKLEEAQMWARRDLEIKGAENVQPDRG